MTYLVFTGLALLGVLFVLWPLLRRERQESAQAAAHQARLQTHVQLFHEHMQELQAALVEGRIDQAQFEQLKLEQERHLLEDESSREYLRFTRTAWGRWLLVGSALGVLLLAGFMYYQQGNRTDLAIQALLAAKQQEDQQAFMQGRHADPQLARTLAEALEARLRARPDHSQYWFLLARTRMELGQIDAAVAAYQQVLTLDAQSSLVMGELAQALFLRDDNRITPPVVELAGRAVALDPQNTTALGLLGIDAFQRKDYAAAINHWQRALDLLGPGSAGGAALQAGLARARSEAASAGQIDVSQQAEPEGPVIRVRVSLAEPLDLSPELPVFVYARAWQGPRMPLAIARLTLGDLPADVTLTQAMAMSEAASLAQATRVEVVARVAVNGSAIAQAGDWQGSLGPVDPRAPAADLHLRIDQLLTE